MYNAQLQEERALMAQQQAQDAIRRGDEAQEKHRQQVSLMKGRQRAGFAAGGVLVDAGSAADVLDDTEYFGELDAQNIAYNAALEAWGYQKQSADYLSNARLYRMQKASPGLAAASPLLNGATDMAFKFASFG